MKRILVMFLTFLLTISYYSSVMAATITDIQNHWGKSNIEELINIGAINGYADNTFRPDNTITRAEFVKIHLASLGSNPGNVASGHWANNYIAESKAKGYIKDGEFDNIDQNITRGEIARIIIRSLEESYPENMDKYAEQITDYNSISSKYKEYALKAYVKGIVTGYPNGTFGADKTATRAEASTMIVRMLDESKRIVPELQKDIADIPFPDTDEAAVIKRLQEMKPDNDRWSNMEDAHEDFLKRYGTRLDEVYSRAILFEDTFFQYDYRTIASQRQERIDKLNECLGSYSLGSYAGEHYLTVTQVVDKMIERVTQNTAIRKQRFFTDKSLIYLGGRSEGIRVRGCVQVYYADTTKSDFLEGFKSGVWYEADVEVAFGRVLNEETNVIENNYTVIDEITVGNIRVIE